MSTILLHGNSKNRLTASINTDNGQLVSLMANGLEYMHGGGRSLDDPARTAADGIGWPTNSEAIMFPIVSASKGHKVLYDGKTYNLGQHGIVRAMKPQIHQESDDTVSILYTYLANQVIDNSKKHLKDPKNPKEMSLPFGFTMEKKHNITDFLSTQISIENTFGIPFCYALGWHPAFRSNGNPKKEFFYTGESNISPISLDELTKFPAGRAKVLDTNCVLFSSREKPHSISVFSDYLEKTMLWSPAPHMFCIEPITEKRDKGALIDLSPHGSYKNILQPGEKKTYHINILLG